MRRFPQTQYLQIRLSSHCCRRLLRQRMLGPQIHHFHCCEYYQRLHQLFPLLCSEFCGHRPPLGVPDELKALVLGMFHHTAMITL
ncbi:hypothetical protein HanHA300_Chr13g0473851 [Helianthus annuus]|nr:hypothetical protein HanHA300_Chr13g0473851 [Helianthus annuus]KAJ0496948.1 hypothetical protein HanHA89_Chr13g0505771 [Helianthus annuus]KAJ0662979.1 hypothetical protein HanLR1_Chr13g0475931 [Helianthus annuus]